jgi:hypothetical protein
MNERASNRIALPPPPRRIAGTTGGRGEVWFGRIFVLPHTLIGIGALGYLVFMVLWRLFGTDIPGVVTGTEISHSRKGKTTYLLKYRYEVAKVVKFGEAAVDPGVYERFQTHGESSTSVTVHYFALGPLDHARLREGGSLWTEVGLLTLWAGFWNTAIGLALYQLWVVPLKLRWLYKHGEASTGTLTAKRVATGRSSTYYVTYTFRERETGQLLQKETQVSNIPAWHQLEAGQPLTVLYAPGNPTRSAVYELCGYRVKLDEMRF